MGIKFNENRGNNKKKINIIYMAKQTYSSLESLKFLLSVKEIRIVYAVIREKDIQLHNLCKENNIEICKEKELKSNIQIKNIKIDYILSYYWKKVSREILELCTEGINFHPGPLPEARGSGYHMAILEEWGYWGVTAHYMDEEYDTGDIIQCERFNIPTNIVNQDLVQVAHEHLVGLFIEIINRICAGETLPRKSQKSGHYYDLKKIEEIKLITDIDDEKVIERKIHAFWNPPYRGAQIEINGKRYTVIDDEVLEWIKGHIR